MSLLWVTYSDNELLPEASGFNRGFLTKRIWPILLRDSQSNKKSNQIDAQCIRKPAPESHCRNSVVLNLIG